MGRPLRAAEGGLVYHCLNRANGWQAIFAKEAEFEAFEGVLAEAVTRHDMRLLAYCVMSDHFHLVLWPRADGDLSSFMRWVTLTHTQRWHSQRGSAGSGHVYQGRFKSFPVQCDEHLHTVCRYVERNALRAGLVDRAEQWRWGSLWWMKNAPPAASVGLQMSAWPIPRPRDWVARVNRPMSEIEEEAMARSIRRGQPFGALDWQSDTVSRLGLEATFRPRGRPKKDPSRVSEDKGS